MPDKQDPSLEERIEHLEQLVEKLQYTIERMQDRITTPAPRRDMIRPERPPAPSSMSQNGGRPTVNKIRPTRIKTPASQPPVEEPTDHKRNRPLYSLDSEAWLNRIGIGIVIVGIAQTLNYTFAQDWFTPLLRVMSGSFVGFVLLALGLHFHRRRPLFGQVLLVSGVATFYFTAYVAYQLYELIPYSVAFVGMLIITVLSFLLAERRDDTVMAIMATLGGLVTPFIMHSDKSHLLVLVVYTSLILVGSGAIYWFRGWRSLLFISAIGSWLVLLFCYFNFAFRVDTIASERWILQGGTFVSCVLFWLMPFVRGILRASNPYRWPAPPPVKAVGYFFNHPALPLSVTTPIFTMIMSMLIWDLSENLWGWIFLLASSIFGFIYLLIRLKNRPDLNHLAQMQGLTATIFLTGGIYLLYDSHQLLIAMIVAAVLIRIVALRMYDRLFALASHTIVFTLFIWIGLRLYSTRAIEPFIINAPALSELTALVLIALIATTVRTRWLATTYFTVSHILLLGWIYRQLEGMVDGQTLITTAWVGYAVLLFILAVRTNRRVFRIASVCTLAVVVGKLFFLDLADLPFWMRLLLLVGSGLLFGVLSFVVPHSFKRPTEPDEPGASSPPESPREQAVSEQT